MTNFHEHIRAEFRRYYPDATRIDVHFDESSETWTVGVVTMGGHHIRNFQMEVGSDDDWFTFTNTVSGAVITVPLPPEAVS